MAPRSRFSPYSRYDSARRLAPGGPANPRLWPHLDGGALMDGVSTIADAAARATVLLSAAAALTMTLRHRSAELRHLVWSVALTGALVLPFIGLLLPTLPVPIPQALADGVSRVAPTRIAAALEQSVPSSPERGSIGAVVTDGFPWPDVRWPGVLLVAWLLGTALLATRALVGRWRAGRLARRADDMASGEWQDLLHEICDDLGIRRPVRLLRSPHASVPMTWGWRRPIVLVPPDAEHWSTERRLLVLRHELVHVKRGDYVTQLLGQGAVALYWFHPLVWFAASRLRIERERACVTVVCPVRAPSGSVVPSP